MIQSATGLREQKRTETSRRISSCAQQLTLERGLDGFTMDDLAEAAAVSRRTLFNYFEGKLDAVLGERPCVPQADLATFVAGGPHGTLIDDVAELARAALSVKQPERTDLELAVRVLRSEPRVRATAHEHFEAVVEDFAALVVEREGAGFGADRARLLLRVVLTLFDTALATLVAEGPGRTLVEVFDEQLEMARALFT